MIGKTALALAALAALVAASVLFVWASGFALYFLLQPGFGPAGAAGLVALTDILIIALGFGVAKLIGAAQEREDDRRERERERSRAEEGPSLMGLFADAVKDKPLTALLVSAVTGFAAVKNPQIFKELLGDILRGRRA